MPFHAMLFDIQNFYSEHKARLGLLGKALSISVFNQAVSSGTNFLFGLYLVRVLSPTDFGLYGIGFAISLFYAGIGNSLLLTQMVVYAPEKEPNDRLQYAARVFTILSIFCFSTLLVVWSLVQIIPNLFGEYRHLGYGISAISVFYLLKEFFIRHAYNIHKEINALLVHIVLAGTLGLIVVGSYIFHLSINVEFAIAGYALAHMVAAIVGFAIAKLPFNNMRKRILLKEINECWLGGKWAFITNIVYFLRTQAHTIVVTASVGPVGVGYLNAARLLVTPAVMLTPALGQVFMPRLAQTRARYPEKVFSMARILTGILLSIAIIYSIVLMGSISYISTLLLGDKYADSIFWLVAGWCVVSCLLALRNGAEMTAQVLKRFGQLTLSNTVSAVVTLLCVYFFVNLFGIAGSLVGLAIGEITLIILVWMVLIHHMKVNNM